MIQQRLAMVWQDRTLREQRLLLLAAWLIFMGCIFFGVIDPALTGRRYWLQTLPLLRDEQTQMQALAKQLSQLQTEQVASTSNLDRTTIERSLAAAGLTPASLQLSEQQLKLEWVNISFSALTLWLQDMQREHAWSVREAHVTGRDSIDRVDAKLTLGD